MNDYFEQFKYFSYRDKLKTDSITSLQTILHELIKVVYIELDDSVLGNYYLCGLLGSRYHQFYKKNHKTDIIEKCTVILTWWSHTAFTLCSLMYCNWNQWVVFIPDWFYMQLIFFTLVSWFFISSVWIKWFCRTFRNGFVKLILCM